MSIWVTLSMELDTGGKEPYSVQLFESNITHNLVPMAKAANLYLPIWNPRDICAKSAADIIDPLQWGLDYMRENAHELKKLNPKNGWGNYDDFMEQVEEYKAACTAHPKAEISAHG